MTRPIHTGPVFVGPGDEVRPQTGIAVALYPSDLAYDFEIQRAPDSAGAPNTGAAVSLSDTIPGGQDFYLDELPLDGATYWYRVRHVGFGDTPSSWTGWLSAVPTPLPLYLARPRPVRPIVKESFTQSGTTGTCTLDIIDPQSRVTKVEFNTQSGTSSASGWIEDTAAPYTTSVTVAAPSSLIDYRVTGYDEEGRLVIIEQASNPFGAGGPRLLVVATLLTPSTTAPQYLVTVTHNGASGTASASIAHTVSSGLSVSPSSPRSVSVPSGSSGGSELYTVTLPGSPGTAPQGTIVFTATASGYVGGAVTLVVTEDLTPPTLEVTTAQSSTAYTFTYSSNGTVYLRTDSGSWSLAPASPFDVSRNSAGGADKTAQIRAVGANGVVTGPRTFTVPAQTGGGGGGSDTTAVITAYGLGSVNYASDTIDLDFAFAGSIGSGSIRVFYFFVTGSSEPAPPSLASASQIASLSGISSPYNYAAAAGVNIDSLGSDPCVISYQLRVYNSGGTLLSASQWEHFPTNYNP